MRFGRFWSYLGVVLTALLSACSQLAPGQKEPPTNVVRDHPPPFLRDNKVEIPEEAKALGHFFKGRNLLIQGEFAEALVEYEAAVQADPSSAYLRFRLAALYIRKGDLERALSEAKEASRLEPKGLENHRLLAGLSVT